MCKKRNAEKVIFEWLGLKAHFCFDCAENKNAGTLEAINETIMLFIKPNKKMDVHLQF